MAAFVVALLGSESTGKTTLAGALGAALRERGLRVGVVDEALREFCELHGRVPLQAEQAGIAAAQSDRIDAAVAAGHEVVIADTTALTIAVYSDLVYADRSLYAAALAEQARYPLTLLTALDLPWQADGLQRTGAHVQAPVDALLSGALEQAGIGFQRIGGHGPARLSAALAAFDARFPAPRAPLSSPGRMPLPPR